MKPFLKEASRKRVASLEESMEKADAVCYCLTAMVGLWRSLVPQEKRHVVANATMANLSGIAIPSRLQSLLLQASEGRGTWVKDATPVVQKPAGTVAP